jgi:hypothetical protein
MAQSTPFFTPSYLYHFFQFFTISYISWIWTFCWILNSLWSQQINVGFTRKNPKDFKIWLSLESFARFFKVVWFFKGFEKKFLKIKLIDDVDVDAKLLLSSRNLINLKQTWRLGNCIQIFMRKNTKYPKTPQISFKFPKNTSRAFYIQSFYKKKLY